MKCDLRQTMILEHHQMQSVRQIRLLRSRQLDLQDVIRHRCLALQHHLRRRWCRWPGAGACPEARRRSRASTRERRPVSCRHHWPPSRAAAGLGIVSTTLRPFSQVLLGDALHVGRCDLGDHVGARVDPIGVVVEQRVLRQLHGAVEGAAESGHERPSSAGCAPSPSPSRRSARLFTRSIS